MKKYFKSLSKIGINPDLTRLEQRDVVLCNKIAFLMAVIAILAMVISSALEIYAVLSSSAILLLSLIIAFGLNRYQHSLSARFIVSILPVLTLVYPFAIGAITEISSYYSVSYIFIGLIIVPLVLFFKKSDWPALLINLSIHFIVIVYFNFTTLGISQSLIYNAIPQLVFLTLMIVAFQFLKKESYLVESDLISANEALSQSNAEIKMQKEEISAQNDFLNSKQIKIEEQAADLMRSNNELNNTKVELLKLIDKLQDAKEKLLQKEAEAKSILNALNDHYLVAQYDLNGKLVEVNDQVVEVFGKLKPSLNNIKTIVKQGKLKAGNSQGNVTFTNLWPKIIKGKALAVDIEIPIGNGSKYFSATLAPLVDPAGKPYRILAIAQDISELIDSKEKISKINAELHEKIHEISDQNLLLNHQQLEIFNKNEELKAQSEEIRSINESLEIRVKERTQVLEEKNKQLAEYAFINSHVLRAPVSTMLGLINLISYSNLPVEDQKIYNHLLDTAKVLDTIIYKINHAIKNGSHFDRKYLEPERDFQPMD